MKYLVSKIAIICLSIIISVISLEASKIKSSESYLKKLDTTIKPLNKNLNYLKQMLNSVHKNDSLLTTDFWGLKPTWYVSGNEVEKLSTAYPFTESWVKGYGIWRRHSDSIVRNINGVILKPVSESHRMSPRSWTEELLVRIDFSPGFHDGGYYQRHIKKQLQASGVPASNIKVALEYFSKKADIAIQLVSNEVYTKFDKLYSGVAKMGYKDGYEYIAKKLDKKGKLNPDDYLTPHRHAKLFTEELFKEYKSTMEVNSRKELYKDYNQRRKEFSLFDQYKNNYKLSIDVPIQHFVVAKGMSKNQQYNQLKKLKEMLDKKVTEGKATVKRGKTTIYESVAKSSKGRIGINFKTGEGYWQLPFWDTRKYVQYYFKEIENNVKDVNVVLDKYLSLALKETIAKYKNTNTQTNDF